MKCGHFLWSVDICCHVWSVVTALSVDIFSKGVDNTVYVDIFRGVWTFLAGCGHFMRVWLLL